MLTIGQTSPDFLVSDQDNQQISLASFKGAYKVIYFYPKDSTPGCTIESKEFSDKKDIFNSLNTVILGVSKDSVKSHCSFIENQGLTITLLSDPDLSIIEPYGVWQEKKNYGKTYMGIVRTTVLLDPEDTVLKVWKNVKVNGHVDAVLSTVKELVSVPT